MEYVKTVNGDLLDATETYIAHQCNCISTNAKTLAELIFNKYPDSNSYSKRINGMKSTYGKPGTIEIFGNTGPYIINMYAQYYPAKSKYPNDSMNKRIEWFKECLNHISQIKNTHTHTIAMPYNIGCGAAGGDWNIYYKILTDFANKEKIHITLYKL